MRIISETIGKFLRESSIERSNFIHGNDRFDLWATIPHPQPWLGWNAPPDTPLGGINPNSLFGIFSNALNSGILDRYKVYPGSGVHGFIYFPFPGLNWNATASGFPQAAEYVYTIEIITQNGSKYIDFEPH